MVDLAYGDSGKGTTVDWLCRQRTSVEAVVRFHGGPQAGHNVVLPDGRHHEFAQFGSGTLAGVPTFLSEYMALDPLKLAAESLKLQRIGVPEPLDLITVDAECLIVTPFHKAAQQRVETLRGDARHGSCGSGFGEAVSNEIESPDLSLRMKDLGTKSGMKRLNSLLDSYYDRFGAHFLHDYHVDPLDAIWDAFTACNERLAVVDGHTHLKELFKDGGDVVFEGAQGVLLDEWYGFHPYTTWSNTTFHNADMLCQSVGQFENTLHIGVVRSYLTRHGPGPFVSEAEIAIPELHNHNNHWQGAWRTGHFDFPAIRYAIGVSGGVDTLAITHLDRAQHIGLCVESYRDTEGEQYDQIPYPTQRTDLNERSQTTAWLDTVTPEYIGWGDSRAQCISAGLGIEDVLCCSWGPTWRDKTRDLFSEDSIDRVETL